MYCELFQHTLLGRQFFFVQFSITTWQRLKRLLFSNDFTKSFCFNAHISQSSSFQVVTFFLNKTVFCWLVGGLEMLCYCMLFYSEFPTECQMFQQCYLACAPFCQSVCVTAGTCCSFNEGLVKAATCHWRISKFFAFLFSPSWSVHPELSSIF